MSAVNGSEPDSMRRWAFLASIHASFFNSHASERFIPDAGGARQRDGQHAQMRIRSVEPQHRQLRRE